MLLNKTTRVMEAFLGSLNSYKHGSGIAREARMNQKTVSNILNMLERKKVLKSRTEGRNKLFAVELGDGEAALKNLLLFETEKTIDFLEKYPKIKEIVRKIRPFINGIAVIFGSYAKGNPKKDSDIDLFVVGEHDKDRIKEISELYNINISIKSITENAFKAGLAEKDILINEIIACHILISGAEKYLEMVLRYYYGK